MGIMCAKAVVAPGKPFCMCYPRCQTEGGYNMGIVYFRDNESEIGIPRPLPGLRGKTLPSSGPSPISSSPQNQPVQPPAPFSFHSPTSLFPGLPACFPDSSWWHLASRLLLRRSLFCRLSLTFIMCRHHERASVFLAECCLSTHTVVYLPIS